MRRFIGILGLLLVLAAPAVAKVRTGPAGDAFYTPPSPLPGKHHGDLIWAREKHTHPLDLPNAGRTWKVLYRSVDADGRAVAVSGLVSLPKQKAPKRGWPVITYAHDTTGIADECAPSRDSDDNPAHEVNTYIYPLLTRWLRAGWAVVRTDYQGLGTPGEHGYLIGAPEGQSTLDIVRAARELEPRLSKRFAISGHTHGGHAALWAASLAPKWTPELKLRGTVAFAPVSHLSEIVPLYARNRGQGGALTVQLALIARAMDDRDPQLDLPSLFTDEFAAVYPDTRAKCVPQLNRGESLGFMTVGEIFKRDSDLAPLAAAIDENDPENLTVKSPLDIEQGDADDLVGTSITNDLVDELRARGARVGYKRYETASNSGIVQYGADRATAFLQRHLR